MIRFNKIIMLIIYINHYCILFNTIISRIFYSWYRFLLERYLFKRDSQCVSSSNLLKFYVMNLFLLCSTHKFQQKIYFASNSLDVLLGTTSEEEVIALSVSDGLVHVSSYFKRAYEGIHRPYFVIVHTIFPLS